MKRLTVKHLEYIWRVPVEVVPIDLAADLLMCGEWWNGKYHVNCGDQMIEADTPEQLRELVIAKLRELSQEETV